MAVHLCKIVAIFTCLNLFNIIFNMAAILTLTLEWFTRFLSDLPYLRRSFIKLYIQEVFHVYLNKFKNAIAHLFLVKFVNK